MSVNQTSEALDQYLEETFATPDEQKKEQPEQAGADEAIIDQYFTGEDDTVADAGGQAAQPPAQVPANTQTPPANQQAPMSIDEQRLQIERELAASKAQLAMYQQAFFNQQAQSQQPAQVEQPAPIFNPEELEIPPELIKEYGHAEDFITRVARKAALELYNRSVKPVESQLQQTQQMLQNQSQVTLQQRQETFMGALKTQVPDLDTLAFSPEWQSFIQQPDEYGGTRTIAQYVQDGINSGNVNQVVAIVNKFRAKQSGGQPQQAQVAPGRAPQFTPQTANPPVRKLKMAGFDRATADFEAGKLSWDLYQKVVERYNDAILKGNVI